MAPSTNAQLAVQTEAVDQLGAFSQNGASAPLRRYAQRALPESKDAALCFCWSTGVWIACWLLPLMAS